MQVINKNNKEVAFKEFKCAYGILKKIKKENLTLDNAEIAVKAFGICYEFVLKIMEVKVWEVGSVLSLPKYLLLKAVQYNIINDLEVWMIFYDAKEKLKVNQDNVYKGKLACSVMKILEIFKIKADEIMKSFEIANKAIY